MGKKKLKSTSGRKTKPKPKREHTQFQSEQPQDTPKARKVRKSVVAILSLLVTLIPFVFLVWPRLSVYPGEALDPYRPFEMAFILKNDGYFSLFNVDFNVKVENVRGANIKLESIRIEGLSRRIPKIPKNTASTILIDRYVNVPIGSIDYAELYFYISYKPFLIPFTFKDTRRFKIDKKRDGSFVWNEYYSKE